MLAKFDKTKLRMLILGLIMCGVDVAFDSYAETPKCDSYLFAYFEGRGEGREQEHLRFALSDDGVNWKALNRNAPIIASDTISLTGGIRDPHILRGEDGCYYMVATDMNTVRDGWGSNPGIVMLKSDDLVNWNHSTVNLSKDFPKHFADAYWVWALQTIFDPEARKYMVYFTLRHEDKSKGLVTYYAYANRDFTGFESEPKVLFRAKDGCIDNDIVKGPDGLWHMFFKGNTKDSDGNEIKNGIKQATAKHLRGPWKESFDYIDAYAGATPVEGSGIFRLNDSGEYVLMYDLYTSGRYEYQTSDDLVHFSPTPKSFTKDFFPRHGTVMPITLAERDTLLDKWGSADSPSEEKDMDAYLMVFFTDATHDLFMATSPDGYTFTAVNDGKPVIGGDTIAEQRGIRDPHISRGPDGAFYLAMTDFLIFAKDKGLRQEQWERPAEQYGWGNNRGLVLMKSFDLINWTRSNLRIDKLFPEKFGDIGCAWAPETTYDPREEKMMIYFTMRVGNGRSKLYYAYTDDDFTRLVTEPKQLFEYPNPEIQVLDADITPIPGGRWCIAYVAQDGPSGIKIATSDSINSGWEYRPEWVDFEPKSCEAPNVWKRIGQDKWVVMYDIFGINPHNFGFAETSDFKTFTNLGRFNEGVMKTTNFQSPKHGAVIPITLDEKRRLEDHWK